MTGVQTCALPIWSLGHHPLIQVVLACQNFGGRDADPAAALALGDLDVTTLPLDTGTARMDLAFSLSEHWTDDGEPAGISGTAEFRTDVFDAARIEALVERWQRVLADLTTDPSIRVSSIDALEDDEHARLDEFGNRVVLSQGVTAVSIPGVFAGQVVAAPGAVAVSCAGVSMTYRELEIGRAHV